MNSRCYRCGNSFALSREAVEAAVAAATPDQKFHVAYCPRCRQANKIPMQQLRRTLPPGWAPAPAAPDADAVVTAVAAPVPVAAAAPAPTPEPVAEVPAAKAPRKRAAKTTTAEPVAEATAAKAPRKRAAKTTAAEPASAPVSDSPAIPAAKKASRSKAKPS